MKTDVLRLPPGAPASPVRRALIGAMCGTMLGCGSVLPCAGEGVGGYALTPLRGARRLADSTPRVVADAVVDVARRAIDRRPHPMPLVRTAGLLPGEGLRTASQQAQEDWRQTRLQGLAFRLSGDVAHADCALAYIRAWMKSYVPSFNPIDETQLPDVLFGADLLQDRLDPNLADRIRRFSVDLARGYLARQVLVGDATTALNNWHSNRIKIGTAGAFRSADPALIDTARDAFFAHVCRNIRDNGKTYDFEQRDAMHYVVYTLEPMLITARMAQAHGEDWYGAPEVEGRVARALEWFRPYAVGERVHEEFVRSTVEFDRRRAMAGVKGFAGLFDRNEAATLYWMAACLDNRFDAVSNTLAPPPAWVRALFPRHAKQEVAVSSAGCGAMP